MINVLFAAREARWPEYQIPLQQAFAKAGLTVNLSQNHPPDTVDYIVYAPNSDVQDFAPYTKCRGVLNLWAGVEDVVHNETLTQPLARMVDYGLTQGMIEWVTGHVLRLHLGMDAHILGQDGVWRTDTPPLSKDRRVSIFGLGALGAACGQALASLGFPVTGWSRSPKDIAGITCLNGDKGFQVALEAADIAVLLVPLTPQTTGLINAAALAQMPKGAMLLNPARGPVIDDEALLAALESGHIAQATLDVFAVEPLPADHPYWAHPAVTVTPHIASTTRADTASEMIAKNIARDQNGQGLIHLVDRTSGY
ncbi:2-hydroxyacid dehydrogenase [Algirhabdus cladophorae]|uniref:2-hydroxyacid dehydrogenase n=1 Tax=Algirhabdus cladophorae TaxID=3377108 RepID=UPI003B84790C